MKTINNILMKAGLFILIISLVSVSDLMGAKKKKSYSNKDYIELTGRIIDKDTREPLMFAAVAVEGENTATITNEEGEFLLKVLKTSNAKNILVSYLGYKSLTYPITNFGKKKHTIKMESTSISLKEVHITPSTPDQIVKLALKKVAENYPNKAQKMTSFYREYIKKKRKYVSLAEGIMDIYKTGYLNKYSDDQVKIIKGRKGTDTRRLDTLMLKIQGGPATTLLLDVAKYSDIIFYESSWENYKFTMQTQQILNGRVNYVIGFQQMYRSVNPMYTGVLYIDTENLAISGADFQLNMDGLYSPSSFFVKKKPAGVKIEPTSAAYKVRFREQNDKWYFYYARAELKFKAKWKKRLFATNYTTLSEMVITDRLMGDATKMKNKERFKNRNFFAQEVKNFYDEEYWGAYNTIKPDDSIESAIRRLKRINR